ncbi:MAG: HisA/HisF-related TIM barrel protein [Hyphomicrobiaceae bacterium]|nr:HisA/HisF-related TIM barrel protein [Hyphomicrobiaceae bacterium]
MHIIPVLDIRQGRVVHAVAGDRTRYRPIVTPLAPDSCDPVDVARGLLRLWAGFRHLYIADLDGIERGERGAGRRIAHDIMAAFPDLTVMIDEGATRPGDVERLAGTPAILPVIGSESWGDPLELGSIGRPWVLSLDDRGGAQLGPSELFEDPSLWPATVIVMTLARVGGAAGPDVDRVSEVVAKANGRAVLAAGGVRGGSDLRRLAAAGAAGALVATALHDGRLTAADLSRSWP